MTDAKVPAARAPRRGPSAFAKLAFSAGLVVSLFLLLEVAARAAGAGDPMAFGGSRLQYQQIYPPLFRLDEGKKRFRPRDPRLVDRSFSEKAPPPRVFVFGESAVAGLGMSENASFSRALERDLRGLGPPAEVVNCGVVALDSRQVLLCVKDVCARQHPDWVVLHVGNNEFLELHALLFLEATGKKPLAVTMDEILRHSRLYLALKNKSIESRNRELTPKTFSTDALRLSERQLVETKGVEVSPADVDAAVSKHKENLRACVEVARASGAKVILMTVATNLEWAGMKDPEGGWLEKACGKPVPDSGEARTKLLDDTRKKLDVVLGDPEFSPLERWEAAYMKACVLRAAGQPARAFFQRASDEDPHLRRCLSRMNENVRALAKESGAVLVDGESVLAEPSRDGITGFEMLYDYVHFTPEGSERLGAALAAAILGKPASELATLVDGRRSLLASREKDALEVDEYLGWNADRSILSDRDLWKYEKASEVLRKRADEGKASPEELVWAANGSALTVGGEARARELYAKARAAKPELGPLVDRNVRWLDER